jgi:hypothetical protein
MENQRILHWEKQEAQKLEKEVEKIFLEKGTEIQIPEVDTSDWLTYEDKEKGFSFKYPKDWELKQLATEEEIERYKDENDDEGRNLYTRWKGRRLEGKLENRSVLSLKKREFKEALDPKEEYNIIIFELISRWNKHDPWYVWIENFHNNLSKNNSFKSDFIKNKKSLSINGKFHTSSDRLFEIGGMGVHGSEISPSRGVYYGIIQTLEIR